MQSAIIPTIVQDSQGQTNKTTDADYISWRRLHFSKSKLSNCIEMAEIMSGFAVVVTVELQINDQDVHPWLLIAFVVTTCLLVTVSLLAVMISTCILPHLESVAKMALISQVHHSPHESMSQLIDLSWVLTNTFSIFFFTLDVILMAWIKFSYFTRTAAIAATIIMGPVLVIILAFGIIFYRKVINHQYSISTKKFEELEWMREQLSESRYRYSYRDLENPPLQYQYQYPSGHSSVNTTTTSLGTSRKSIVSGNANIDSSSSSVNSNSSKKSSHLDKKFQTKGLVYQV